ncbi:MAG: putative Ig domain-containing protein [Bryobacteraceae bacterium]
MDPIPLPDGRIGEKYQASALDYLTIRGGVTPYQFEVTGNSSVPAGLILDKTSGVIAGIPAEAKVNVFSIRVVDAMGTAAPPEVFVVKVLPAPLTVVRKPPPLQVLRTDHLTVARMQSDRGPTSEHASSIPHQRSSESVTSSEAERPQSTTPAGDGTPQRSSSKENPSGASSPGASGSNEVELMLDPVIPGAKVISGSHAPRKAMVTLKRNEQIIQSVTADEAGQFSTALDKPADVSDNFSATMPLQSARIKVGSRVDVGLLGEPDIRAVVGFHQAGASGATSHQNFFSDFYLDRHLWHTRWRLWGDVRIASTPQQISAPVSQFVAGFPTQVGNLQVNQVAQTAEFQTGLEWVWRAWDLDWRQSVTETSPDHRVRTLGFIVGGGATGPFNPVDTLQLFNTPPPTSPQYGLFKSRYPTVGGSQYVGFVSPDRDRFYRQYQLGVKLSTYSNSKNDVGHKNLAPRIAAPATYTFTLGQDEAVTGGRFRGLVGRIEVFYPLPITGQANDVYKFLYLFGTTSLRLTRANNETPLILQPAAGVNGYDPGVAIVTAPSNRDNYRIGIGVDFVNLFKTFVGCKGSITCAANQ